MGWIGNKDLYPNDSTISRNDYVIGTDSSGASKTFQLDALQSILDSSGYTRAQMQTLISNSALKEGVRYKITDAGIGNETIIVTAATSNTLFEMCLNISNTADLYEYNISTDTLDVFSPSSLGDMTKDVYDPAQIEEQLVGLTSSQSLTNKTIEDYTNHVHADVVHVRAKATTDILKGQAVYITGYNVGESALEVALANNATNVATGVAYQDIGVGEFGLVIMSGILTNVNTDPYNEGDILWVDGDGSLVNVEPDSGYAQPIAYVLRKHANNGAIQVLAYYPKQDAADVRFTPYSTLSSTNVQSAIQELLNEVGTPYTNENAQDAVGSILSNEFTYSDETPSVSINLISSDKITDGTTNRIFTSTEKTKLSGIATGADVTNATSVGVAMFAANTKSVPTDTDTFAINDAEDSDLLKKFSWANIKTYIKAYYDSVTSTFTNKTFDANGTGNSISNIEAADFASGVLDTDLSSVAATDTTIPSAKATKTALDAKQDTLVSGTNIKTINGNTLLGSGNLTISGGGTPAGSAGQIQFNNAGAFGADSLLAWDNTNKQLGIGGAGSARLFSKGSGTSSASRSLSLENSNNTKSAHFYDDGTFEIKEGKLLLSRVGNDNSSIAKIEFTGGNGGNGSIYMNQNFFMITAPSGINTTNVTGVNYFTLSNSIGAANNCHIRTGNGFKGGIFFLGNGGAVGNSAVCFSTEDLERARFTPTGNMLIGTTTDVSSSILTINSTTKGFLPPRMTTTQKNAITSPVAGLVVFDTTLNKLCVFTTVWETVTSA